MSSYADTADPPPARDLGDMSRFNAELEAWRASVAAVYLPVRMGEVAAMLAAIANPATPTDVVLGFAEWLGALLRVMLGALATRDATTRAIIDGSVEYVRAIVQVLASARPWDAQGTAFKLLNAFHSICDALRAHGLCKDELGRSA